MVYTRSQVVARANASLSYPTRMCMQWTRMMVGMGAIGDFDGDRAADAEDGWKSSTTKHPGDRKPPAGTMVFYGGGSQDNGHAAISLGPDRDGRYLIRTTDGNGAGKNGTRFLDYPEKSWGMPYLGWTEGIGDEVIVNDLEPPRPRPVTRGKYVDAAIRKLKKVDGGPKRKKKAKKAIEILESIKIFAKKP